jgi:hypothetical protein
LRSAQLTRRAAHFPVAAGDQTELLIGRHGHVDQLWPGQVQAAHHHDELVACTTRHPAVGGALLTDRGLGAALVVMRRIDTRVVGQAEEFLRQAVEQRARIAGLEIGAAAAVDQQRIAGEDAAHHAIGGGLLPQIAHAAGGMPGRVDGP